MLQQYLYNEYPFFLVRSIGDCALCCIIAYSITEFVHFGGKLLPTDFFIVVILQRMRGSGPSTRGSPMNLVFQRLLDVDPKIPILLSVTPSFAKRTIFRSRSKTVPVFSKNNLRPEI
ncbi:uncharacterized protein Bfra_006695 [Botrytis fragariae]|uniref:Uncharacterized protein n=1 Tax=Botrytis fragariae TaxID=1964551 RepID=A0A8H6B5S7_9HELO|nr:uncharacterized protein Bfra_006695 [Botrytis fragariae]KAF5879487.1 hypothetical protein Bfra_006695 [Botrytis fragariae]